MKKEDRWAQSYKENLLHKMMCAGFERSDWLPKIIQPIRVMISVTRLGDLLDFGQLFKAFGNN